MTIILHLPTFVSASLDKCGLAKTVQLVRILPRSRYHSYYNEAAAQGHSWVLRKFALRGT